jgi:hypothetical protein
MRTRGTLRRWVVLLALVCACAGQRATPERGVRIEIALTPLDASTWRVGYRFSQPIEALRFRRGAREFERERWKLPAGVRLVRTGDSDVLRLEPAAQELSFEVPVHQAFPDKDYQPYIRFGDGSLLIFTGQFNVEPVVCADAGCAQAGQRELEIAGPTELSIIAPDDARVIVGGQPPEARAIFRGSEDGTYAYVGTDAPVRTKDVIAVSDRQLPAWLGADVERTLPPLFRYYTERFGAALPFTPELFLSYGREESAGSMSFGGGTLSGGVVQLEVRLGSAYDGASDAFANEQTFRLIAHESAHLWNAHLFEDGQPSEWLYEGGADASAFRALRAIGTLTDARYRDRLTEALSLCIVGWDGSPLKDAIARGNVRNAYSCGATLQLWAEALAHRADARVDLFTIWARVFERSKREGYADEAYWKTLLELPAVAPSVPAMRAFVDGPAPERIAGLIDALKGAGIVLAEDRMPPSQEYQRIAGLRAIRHLLAAACGGTPDVSRAGSSIRLNDASGCAALHAGDVITAVNGHALLNEGAAAFDAIAEACGTKRGLTLARARAHDTVTLRCDRPLAPRPPRLHIEAAP